METVFLDLLETARSGVLEYARLERIALPMSTPMPDVLDKLALHVARAYARGEFSFEESDRIMNAVFSMAVGDSYLSANDRSIPSLMFEVYQAFDAGEFMRPDDGPEVDPEVKYTKPLIDEVLARAA